MAANADHKINEQQTALAFSRQSIHFDQLYQRNTIIQYKRNRVRNHLTRYLPRNASILELNAGTGDDAIWLAQHGHHVHATDIASGMQQVLEQKVELTSLKDKVTTELRSFTDLENLQQKGPYDCIFSNFAGLNCTGELEKVLSSFSPLLKEGGVVTLVLLPKFCLWELLLLFKGKFKTATRRFFAKHGRSARVENEYFKCWYYNPSFVTGRLKDEFELLSLEGLCTIVPPSYMEGFAEKYPRFYSRLTKLEHSSKSSWPFKSIGDYYIISLRKPELAF
jgi:ubiquinone/menaquinone biosynthesis C-methylase UbiE